MAEDNTLEQATGSALFWSPDDAVRNEHPDLQALQAIDEETPPEERCDALKEQGNDFMTHHGTEWAAREAVKCYTRALQVEGTTEEQRGTVLSNRAKANLVLRNCGRALEDADEAMRLGAGGAKAAFRACKACLLLGRYDGVPARAEEGLRWEPGNQALKRLRERAERLRADREARERAARRRADSGRSLALLLGARGLRVAKPLLPHQGDSRPAADKEGTLFWRVLVLYPQHGRSDALESVSEGATPGDILDTLLPPHSPRLPWDDRGDHTRDRVGLFYPLAAGEPLGTEELAAWLSGDEELDGSDEGSLPDPRAPDPSHLALASEKKPLAHILAEPGHVVPGFPVFYLLLRR